MEAAVVVGQIKADVVAVCLLVKNQCALLHTMLQTEAGYRACANKRIEIAEHLRCLPMGWFNDNTGRYFASGSWATMYSPSAAAAIPPWPIRRMAVWG